LKKDIEDAKRRQNESEEREREERAGREEKRASSETDYGVEDSPPKSNASNKARSVKGGSAKGSRSIPSSSPTARSAVPKSPPGLITRAGNIIGNMRKLLETMAGNFKTRPLFLLQILAFIVGLLVVLSRKDVKERIKRIVGQGWTKVRQTAGMGVKVSYI
jgi:hypothetical protein